MRIEFISKKSTYQVTLKCSEGEYTTEYTVSGNTKIGNAIRFALEDYYKQMASVRINSIIGGVH